jgi:hypothetical protein
MTWSRSRRFSSSEHPSYVYGTAWWHRFVLSLGLFGLAAMSPAPGVYPSWLVIGVITMPVVLLELGALLVDETVSDRWQVRGVIAQLAGVIAYAFVFCLLWRVGTEEPQAAWLGRTLAGVCGLLVLLVARAAAVTLRGPLPAARLVGSTRRGA